MTVEHRVLVEGDASMWQGLAAAPGIAVGPAVLVLGGASFRGGECPADPGREKTVLAGAVAAVRLELTILQSRTEKELGRDEAAVFGAQILMLDDPSLLGEVNRLIEGRVSAAAAVREVVTSLSARLAALPDEYIRERAVDVRDVGDRLLHHLGATPGDDVSLSEPAVVAGEDLKPSLVARLPREKLLALVSGAGGVTSHVALLARSLGIPAVVGLGEVLRRVRPGDVLAVDGTRGRVTLNPTAAESARWRKLQAEEEERRARLDTLGNLPVQTLDGHRVKLAVNISAPADLESAAFGGVDGVGLFRTEFIYMDKEQLPGEEEQFQVYKKVVSFFAPRPVTIRTMDIGGDKDVPCLGRLREENPFLGLRGLRFSLARPEIFRTQLRAILRAASYGRVKVMFPMVTTAQEVREARAHLAFARAKLERDGVQAAGSIEVGIMIEVPAAAMTAELLAPEVDFFSIGSNDLTQYTMAADRHNEAVAGLYQTFHPAVLRQIERVIGCAQAAGIGVGLCGEMAADPLATVLLLGLGLDEFSMVAPSLAGIKERIRSIRYDEAREMARTALALPDAARIREYVIGFQASNPE